MGTLDDIGIDNLFITTLLKDNRGSERRKTGLLKNFYQWIRVSTIQSTCIEK